jgi:hypothetical protein
MINFYREIRKKLADDNKPLKYMRYAIGEIFLVVVGILIALQINNWNEVLKERALEIKILEEIKENIESDFKDHNQNIEFMERTINSSDVILNHLENNLPYNDSLSEHFSWLAIIPDFYSVSSGYQLLSSKGVNLITNDSLRRDISFLYDNTHDWIKEFFAFLKGNSYRILTEHMVPKFNNFQAFKTYEPRDYMKLLKDEEFKSYVQFNMEYFRDFKRSYEERIALGKNLADRIEKEIEKLKN